MEIDLWDVIMAFVQKCGTIESRTKLMKLVFFADYYLRLSGYKMKAGWIYHYRGPYSQEVMNTIHDLVLEGLLNEGYDPEEGIFIYSCAACNEKDLPEDIDNIVSLVLENYCAVPPQGIINKSISLLSLMHLRPGDTIWE